MKKNVSESSSRVMQKEQFLRLIDILRCIESQSSSRYVLSYDDKEYVICFKSNSSLGNQCFSNNLLLKFCSSLGFVTLHSDDNHNVYLRLEIGILSPLFSSF